MNIAKDRFAVRPMKREEVDWAVACAAAEGWNPGLHDASCFFDVDPQGFLIGTLRGSPVGCISAISYGNSFGFVGFYIVNPEYRGNGYGLLLWKAAVERLKGHNIGLDGVLDQQGNYQKSGFHLAYRNIRYEGVIANHPTRDEGLLPLGTIPRSLIQEYDLQCFPVPRNQFLARWLSMPQSHAIGCIKDNKLTGYGVIRACRRGYKIGPLFADDPGTAESIFLSLSSFAGDGAIVYLDVPEVNVPAVRMAGGYGMKKVFETARMYTGPDPAISVARVFGVTTFELG
jgi:hypothetical protein